MPKVAGHCQNRSMDTVRTGQKWIIWNGMLVVSAIFHLFSVILFSYHPCNRRPLLQGKMWPYKRSGLSWGGQFRTCSILLSRSIWNLLNKNHSLILQWHIQHDMWGCSCKDVNTSIVTLSSLIAWYHCWRCLYYNRFLEIVNLCYIDY